ncbi:hypothetical protein SAMN05216187_10224 [Jeotgalicoccus aerolatus]|uniref:Uncharacterized protein n=1 Tax=Jeotgalicoccus aerolatus TaxID=709510 RepID=A0A1G8VVG4_9STAP|nr:hypothetical protein [Jeotgalicoccus aerolatus]SDJ69465.1 hypothetical protein SAMN05216187_10224 [Jeotgalicoccus aerolatus]
MKVINRINTADANSQYINNIISSLSETHPVGLTVIQFVSQSVKTALDSASSLSGITNINIVYVTGKPEIYNALKVDKNDRDTVVYGSIEDAKIYIKYSHVIIINENLALQFKKGTLDFNNEKIYLTDISNNNSLDAKIYKKFIDEISLEFNQFNPETTEKIIRETNCIIPANLIFHHTFTDHFSFKFNIWMSNLMAVVNLTGEIIINEDICVSGELDRWVPAGYKEILMCLKYIDHKISKRYDEKVSDVLQYFNKIFTSNLKNYIDKGLISKKTLINEMKSIGIKNIYYSALNKGDAKKLVLAYCFPPFNDTSGNVMAKRIFESGDVVDVVSNDMSRIRNKDNKLINIMHHLLDSQIVLTGKQAFSSWTSIEEYIQGSYEKYMMYENKYEEIYSRVMFPHSHFAAFEIKKSNSNIKWIAEFSDPLYTDVSSNIRYAPIEDDEYIEMLKSYTGEKYRDLIDDNSFNVCEVIPFLYADELIFTNEYQMNYMLERFDEEIKSLVISKAVISQHPTLPSNMYNIVKSFYKVSQREINIAYFGNFYDTRGFRQIELVAKELYDNNINNFKIHVFTNLNKKTMRFYKQSDYKEYIEINQYAPYFEFLNLTNLMDVLLIFDAETEGIKPYNPYVPSKLSDYRGSTSKIWAFTEKNSVLDLTEEDNLYSVHQRDYHEYCKVFTKIANNIGKPLYNVDNIKCLN